MPRQLQASPPYALILLALLAYISYIINLGHKIRVSVRKSIFHPESKNPNPDAECSPQFIKMRFNPLKVKP